MTRVTNQCIILIIDSWDNKVLVYKWGSITFFALIDLKLKFQILQFQFQILQFQFKVLQFQLHVLPFQFQMQQAKRSI